MEDGNAGPWWHNERIVTEVRTRRTEGTTYEELSSWLTATYPEQTGTSPHRIRGLFSEKGWNGAPRPAVDVQLEQARIAVQETRRSARTGLGSDARWQNLVDAIEHSVRSRTLPSPRRTPVLNSPEDICVVLPLSDIHAGGKSITKQVGARLEHTPSELGRRFARWTDGAASFIAQMEKLAHVPHVALLGLGDYVENAQMRPGAERNTYETTAESVVAVANHITDALEALLAAFPQTTFSADFLNGNHDRIGHKGEHHPHEAFGTIIGAYVARAFRDTPRIVVTAHTEPSVIVGIGDSLLLLHHGHGLGGGTAPFAAIESRADRFAGYHRRSFQYVFVGHFHHGASWTTNSGFKCFLSPAFGDTNGFAAENALLNPGAQHAHAFLRTGGHYLEHTISLGEPIAASPVLSRWSA